MARLTVVKQNQEPSEPDLLRRVREMSAPRKTRTPKFRQTEWFDATVQKPQHHGVYRCSGKFFKGTEYLRYRNGYWFTVENNIRVSFGDTQGDKWCGIVSSSETHFLPVYE
jgi:hypothetical protein